MNRRSPVIPHLRRVHRSLVLLLSIVLLVGCSTTARPTPTARSEAASATPGQQRPIPATPAGTTARTTATPGSTPTVAARNPALLAQLRDVQTLRIGDSWSGLAVVWLVEMSVELRRTGDSFTGTAVYSAGISPSGALKPTTRTIVIPTAVIMRFVEVLADAPLHADAYIPAVTHTDDYPKLNIALSTPAGSAWFHSESQGKDHLPWGAIINGGSYVVNTPQPMTALALLDPYLQRDVMFGALRRQGEATYRARTSPPPPPPFCRAPGAGSPTPMPIVVATPAPGAPRIAPGAAPHPGEVINLAHYFGLADAIVLDARGNFPLLTVIDPQQIVALVTALDREATVIPLLPAEASMTNAITFDLMVQGHPISFTYLPQSALLTFVVAGQTYVTSAPPTFRALWLRLLCPGAS